MKRIYLLLAILLGSLQLANAQQQTLQFNKDGKFKIVQFTDVHYIQSVPFNLTQTTPGISGVTNFILPVKASDGKRNATVLYCIDSHSYSQIKGVNGYDYIKFDQIQWYRENSKKFTEENNGVPVSSYAFFHIALPEYNQAASSESAILYGIRKEKACAPQLNSGLFAAMRWEM